MAKHILSNRELCDLTLILIGGFSPLTSFMGKADYLSVIENTRLASGQVWPMPIMLGVAAEALKDETLLLVDNQGREWAELAIEEAWEPSLAKEALGVYGTTDLAHPGVRYLEKLKGLRYVAGPLLRVRPWVIPTLRRQYHTPEGLRSSFRIKGWETVIGFQTRNPLHRAHFEITRRVMQRYAAPLLLQPAIGETQEGDIPAEVRLRCYQALLPYYPDNQVLLSPIPLAMRMAGPKEALWHALIRKNYGVTHFIVGRDHSGPKNRATGASIYPPEAAFQYARGFSREIGLEIVEAPELVYSQARVAYIEKRSAHPEDRCASISGTQLRAALAEKAPIPAWLSFPEVLEELTAFYAAAQQSS